MEGYERAGGERLTNLRRLSLDSTTFRTRRIVSMCSEVHTMEDVGIPERENHQEPQKVAKSSKTRYSGSVQHHATDTVRYGSYDGLYNGA